MLVTPNSSAANIPIKLPPFTPDNPDLFLKIVDSIQRNYKLNESELFLNLFVNLPSSVQSASKHLLDNGATNHLVELKKIINAQYKLPLEDRIKKLFMSTSMGDLLPSQYLAHIQNILGEDAVNHEGLIKNQFLAILPNSIAPFIQLFSKDCSLREIALAADKDPIYTKRSVSEIHAMPSPVEQRINAIEEKFNNLNRQENFELSQFKREMEAQLTNLSQQLFATQSCIRDLQNAFHADRSSQNRNFSRYRNTNRSQSRERSYHRRNNHGQCFYHYRFGQNAERCVKPCSYNINRNQTANGAQNNNSRSGNE